MKKIYILFLTLIAVILLFLFFFKKEVQEEKLETILDQLSLTMTKQLHTHQMQDLRTALLLSKNEGLVNALSQDDEDLGYDTLSDISQSVVKKTETPFRAQVITKDLLIFGRSWDDMYAGMPIGDFRKDLKNIEKLKTSRSSLEIGRRLGNKATVPIYKDGVFIGFIEVLSFFKSITNFFASIGVDLYVLLDVNQIESAVLMMQNLSVGDYVVANRNYNYNHIQTLQDIDYKDLKLSRITHKDNKYIFYQEMYDGNLHSTGCFVFVLPEKYLEYFKDPQNDISFLINITRNTLYDIVKKDVYKKNIYDKYDNSAFVYLQDVIEKEDRELFFDEVYSKFEKYSKDELIQMMLNRKVVKKIDGKIR